MYKLQLNKPQEQQHLLLFDGLVVATLDACVFHARIPSTGGLGRRFGEPRLTPENGDPTSGRDKRDKALSSIDHRRDSPLSLSSAMTLSSGGSRMMQYSRLLDKERGRLQECQCLRPSVRYELGTKADDVPISR